MLTVTIPTINGKAEWVEISDDGHYAGRVKAHALELDVKSSTTRFMVRITDANGHLVAYLWPAQINPQK